MSLEEVNKQKCKCCGKLTEYVVNIKLKAVPICDVCADSITIQQVNFIIHNKYVNQYKQGEK